MSEKTFEIDGKTYQAEEARVGKRGCSVEIDDHGLIAITVQFEGPAWGQSLQLGFSQLFQTSHGRAMHAFLALRRFKPGWTGYVLRETSLGPIVGVRDFDINGGEAFLVAKLLAKFDELQLSSSHLPIAAARSTGDVPAVCPACESIPEDEHYYDKHTCAARKGQTNR